MASSTLGPNPDFPAGTTVGAYQARFRRENGSPVGPLAATAVVQADGTWTFNGLADETAYVVYALVDSRHAYTRFVSNITPSLFEASGTQGPQGSIGQQGAPGAAGAPGTKIFIVQGTPSNGLGVAGDLAMYWEAGLLWQRGASNWGTSAQMASALGSGGEDPGGEGTVGQTRTVTVPAGYAVQWYRGNNPKVAIPGATSPTYTITLEDEGFDLSADVYQVVVVPATTTIPGAVDDLSGSAGNGAIFLSWTEPDTGGASIAISSYQITYNPAAGTPTWVPLTGYVEGDDNTFNATVSRTNGTPYTFAIRAVNSKGAGPISNTVGPLTPTAPVAIPGAPTSLVLTAGDALVKIAFIAATGTGITKHQYSLAAGGGAFGAYVDFASPPVSATGGKLQGTITTANGTAVKVRVRGVNSAGNGTASADSNTVTPAAPIVTPPPVVTDPPPSTGGGGWGGSGGGGGGSWGGGGGAGGGGSGAGSGGTPVSGIYIGQSAIDTLPTSGTAWTNLKNDALASFGKAAVSNMNNNHNVYVMAGALYYAKTKDPGVRDRVRDGLAAAIGSESNGDYGTYSVPRALAVGRNVVSYPIAADLIGLSSWDSAADTRFRNWLNSIYTFQTSGGEASIILCHEKRPNNWGTWCGASIAAMSAYLGNKTRLDRLYKVFQGWVGDRSAYSSFGYGDLAYQADPANPRGVNSAGTTKSGHNVDGFVPDDLRRSGTGFPPAYTDYVMEALEGVVMQALILDRAGYTTWGLQSNAIKRAHDAYFNVLNFPQESNHGHTPWIMNKLVGTSYPTINASVGKGYSYTNWTHQ